MSYNYTDNDGGKLSVGASFRTGTFLVRTKDGDGGVIVRIPDEDAPAAALAILEAAGIEPNIASAYGEKRAVACLKVWAADRAETEAREQETARVREFVDAIPGVSWHDESEDHWRHLYRAARDYFGGDK